jgi:hypothetical protein
MLPILSKDAEKQKEIEARAAQQVLESKAKAAMSPKANKTPAKAPATPGKVPMMKIQAIPPWSGAKPKPPAVPIPETAKQDIPLATSPTPSTDAASLKKLNPASKPFEFKSAVKAAPFQPGKPVASPASTSTSGAGPSTTTPQNPFFSQPLRNVTVSKDDFVPWRHGQVPPPHTVCELSLLVRVRDSANDQHHNGHTLVESVIQVMDRWVLVQKTLPDHP